MAVCNCGEPATVERGMDAGHCWDCAQHRRNMRDLIEKAQNFRANLNSKSLYGVEWSQDTKLAMDAVIEAMQEEHDAY